MLRSFIPFLLLFASLPIARAEEPPASPESRSIDLYLSPAGIGIGPLVTFSNRLTVGYHITDADVILADVINLTPYGSDYSERLDALSYGLYYQRFFGRSFYVRGGLAGGRFVEKHSRSDSSDDRRLEGQLYFGEALIGNQWYKGVVTLGCNWIGYALPLHADISRDDGGFGPTIARSGSFEFLQAYIGLSF